jgi:hypothetical protein
MGGSRAAAVLACQRTMPSSDDCFGPPAELALHNTGRCVSSCQLRCKSASFFQGEIERLREVLGETSRELQQAKSLPPVQPTRTLPRVPKVRSSAHPVE